VAKSIFSPDQELLQQLLREASLKWGVEVDSVEIKDVDIPEQMQRAIAKEAEAIREKRARIIRAEGEQEAAAKLSQAAETISGAPGALELRRLQTLSEIGAGLREDPAFKNGIVGDFSFWGVDQVDGSMITLLGQMQCRDTARWPTQREFNRRIAETFRERGIVIANPLRNVLVPGEAHRPIADGADGADGDAQTDGANDSTQARRPEPEPDKKPSAHP